MKVSPRWQRAAKGLWFRRVVLGVFRSFRRVAMGFAQPPWTTLPSWHVNVQDDLEASAEGRM